MTETLDIQADAQADPPSGEAHEVTTESVVEAILFSTDVPLPGSKIAQLLGTGDANDVKRHIETLNERYRQAGASFHIESIAKGYQMLTLPPYNHWVSQLHKVRAESRLSPAALETLAIIAYKQPVLRAQIEAIRGVAVGDMLVRLREMNLARIVGRAEEIGRPLLYGTTTKFLEVFGLKSLKDLPKIDEDDPEAVPPLKPAQGNVETSKRQNVETEPSAQSEYESDTTPDRPPEADQEAARTPSTRQDDETPSPVD